MSVDGQQHDIEALQRDEEPQAKEEARAELRKSVIISYNHRLIETTGL